MKIASLVFSPAGKTMAAAKMFEQAAEARGFAVQTVDWTKSSAVFRHHRTKDFLKEEIREHDILGVFSPVYVHHLPGVVKNLLADMPPPGRKWGSRAVAVVTFGGGSSGSALKEAARILFKSGRQMIAAAKIEAEHCLTRLKPIRTKINAGKPGAELAPFMDDLAGCLDGRQDIPLNDEDAVLAELNYHSRLSSWKDRLLFRETLWQRRLYPALEIDRTLCRGCGVCVRECAVQCLDMADGLPALERTKRHCLHCARGISSCPAGAIQFRTDWDKWNRIMDRLSRGEGPLYTEEAPKTRQFAFLPLQTAKRFDNALRKK